MSVATEIKALDRRIKAARERGTPASMKAAGEMSKVRSDLLLQLDQAKASTKKKKGKRSNRSKLKTPETATA